MPNDHIPSIDIASLFAAPSAAREAADRFVFAAASGIGFMTVHGFPGAGLLTAASRAELLRIFGLPETEKARLLRWNFDASKSNYYRGWFPLQPTAVSYKEGIDMGPDVAHADAAFDPDDPLLERTPLPGGAELPGWREAVATYYTAMEAVGAALMSSVARSLGLAGTLPRAGSHGRGPETRRRGKSAAMATVGTAAGPSVCPMVGEGGPFRTARHTVERSPCTGGSSRRISVRDSAPRARPPRSAATARRARGAPTTNPTRSG